MQVWMDAGVVLLAYVFGAIPFGLLIVKLATGKDIRQVASGRTGGTNAVAGPVAGPELRLRYSIYSRELRRFGWRGHSHPISG